ncbi:LOW QUALITY PROTEIN: lung adenoma susceptibility protein 2, partial [Antrostomus carolinensis]|uniref:LOW QUALITY PROTEIN: lung adenoma susceptibility protein 2 n=1 Tax=Antrostomus carolinensis TaxID=279965 RepID=UPI0010A982F6
MIMGCAIEGSLGQARSLVLPTWARNLDKKHDKLNKRSSTCSPDSTVSSLLASCSMGSNNLYSNSLIQYKDKLYSSASEALEAYIEDFDLSLTSSEVSTGKICICQSTPQKVKFSKHRAKAKRGVFSATLDDFDQRVGLVSPISPSRRQAECDPDLLSLTTDDLLAFPADGSLPFVQPSPSKSNQQSREWNKPSLKTSFCPQSSTLNTETSCAFQENGEALAHQNPPKNLRGKKHNVCTPDKCDSLLAFEANSNTFKNYPRWLTHQKSDLSVSGLSSLPNFPYPLWLKTYNLFSDSAQENTGQTFNIESKASSCPTSEILKKRHSGAENSWSFLEQNDCLDPRGDNKVKESCSYAGPDACFQLDNSFSRHIK